MNKNNNSLVSIITPTYNSERFIEETILSIINQSYTNWELIITDDCSTDSTIEIIRKYVQIDDRIKLFILEKNEGAGIARNNSIKEARGRFIAFCDSDDLWKPNKLEYQISYMIEKQIALSYSNYDIIDENGNFKRKMISPPKVDYLKMLRNDYIGCLTAIYDTKIVGKVFMPSIRKRQDWILWLNILKKENIALNVNENLAIYRERYNSISSNKFIVLKDNWKVYHEYENLSFINSCIHTIRNIIFYLLKRINF